MSRATDDTDILEVVNHPARMGLIQVKPWASGTGCVQLADSDETAWAGDDHSNIHLEHFAHKRLTHVAVGR